MEHSFTWVSAIPGLNTLPPHVATALLVALLLFVFAYLSYRRITTAPDPAVPDGSLTVRNAAEFLVETLSGMAEGAIGPHWRKYVPLYGTFFVFILTANLIGLIPGFSPPTSNFNITLALGAISFFAYNFFAFKELGFGYLKHFLGPVLWLAPLMALLEVIDNVVRPFSLSLRLLGNMTGDHLVIEVFTDLTKLIIPVVFYMLGAFVSVVQAFVFTLLSMVYVSLAVGHGHGGQH